MAENETSFNLLYKVEAQKTFVDKLYDFLVGPARLIIVSVMIVIIGVFGYRFFLDTTLRNEKKTNELYKNQIESIVVPNESRERAYLSMTSSYKIYQDMFKSSSDIGAQNLPEEKGRLHIISEAIDVIYKTKNSKFADTVAISELSISNDPSETVIKLNGSASTFLKVEEFVAEIKSATIVSDASSINLGATRNQNPQYQIDIKLVE